LQLYTTGFTTAFEFNIYHPQGGFMKIYFTAAVSLLFLLFSASGLFAQPENIPDDFAEVGTPPVTGSIGVGVGYAPEFIGSDSYKAGFMPVIFLNYGPVFLSSDKGLGVRFDLFNGSLEISPAVNYRFGRKESDSLLLAGMGDLDGVVTLGGTIAYKFEDFVLSVKTFQGVNESKGLTMDLKAA
jgi:outer membrane scaffolding protein for murein synthesis (MipA/OmpV family)